MRTRLLVNAAVAALAASLYVAFLFVLLNPGLGVSPGAVVGVVLELAPAYTVVLALPGAGAFLLYGWFARRPLPRRWLQWRFWGGFFAFYSLLAVVVYVLNARFFRHLLDPLALERLVQATAAVLAAALVVAGVVMARPLARRRGARALALAVVWGSWGLLAGLSGGGAASSAPPPRTDLEALVTDRPLRILGIDGLSSDLLLPLMSEGRLPAFARLMKEGSHGTLRSFPPGDEVTLWTTIVTGRKPHRHGVYGPQRHRLAGRGEELALAPRAVGFGLLRAVGLVRSRPTAPADRTAPALWDILSSFRVRSAFLGFPLTPEAGDLGTVQLRRLRGAPETAPSSREVDSWLEKLVERGSEPDAVQDGILRAGLAADLRAMGEAERLGETVPPPQLVALRLSGFDQVMHYLMRYHRPEEFGNVSQKWLERYGQSISEYCKFLDAEVAREMEAVRGRGTLLVISPHGMAPVSLAGRALRHLMGGAAFSGQHGSGPSGIFFLYGPGVQEGQKVDSARAPDLLPTTLYLLGLPVARDLDGEPLTQAFTPAFLNANPASSIPTYEGASIQERGPESFGEPEEEEVLPLD
jgi:hypothetical protein